MPPDGQRAADVARRLGAIRRLLDEEELPAVLLHSRRNFAWVTAGGANHVVLDTEMGAAPLLVTRADAVVLAPVNEADRIAVEELSGIPIEVEPVPWHEPGAAARAALERSGGIKPVGDDHVEPRLGRLRSVLTPLDRDRLAWLGQRTLRAVSDALEQTSPGESEWAATARAVGGLLRRGIRAPVVLAAADERIRRFRHPLPGADAVRGRLMLVVVAERWGLHAAVTRIRDFEPPGPDTERRDAGVRVVERAMLAATRPGATLGDVFSVAQAAYAEVGHEREWRDHHQGGVIGYRPRETIATPGDATKLEAGMAVAWNPSIAGSKAEDTYLLDEAGLRRITA